MRLRKVNGAEQIIEDSPICISDEMETKGEWHEIFGNSHPIFLEIGMGKGKFLLENARKFPENNYIGIEKYASVLVRAVEKIQEDPCDNIRLLHKNAQELEDIFELREVEQIFLNFSDPWPKERHVKRRLTAPQFLERYRKILVPGGRLIIKTDNRKLFEYSLDQLQLNGWIVESVTGNLHKNGPARDNIMTEYEQKFYEEQKPICRLVAYYN